MAGVYAGQWSGGGTSGTSDRTAAGTPAVGDMLVVFVAVSDNADTEAMYVTDDQGGAYEPLDEGRNATLGGVTCTLSAHYRTTPVTSAVSHTLTGVTDSNTSGVVGCIRLSGLATDDDGEFRIESNGGDDENVIRQIHGNSGASSTTPTVTFSDDVLATSIIVGAVMSSDTSTTPPANFTERIEANQATPTLALEVATRDSGHTSATVTWGATASSAWAAFAIEIDVSRTKARFEDSTTGGGTSGTGDRTTTISFPNSGRVLIAAGYLETNATTSPTMTDSSGVTWTRISAITNSTDNATLSVFIRPRLVTLAESEADITITLSGGTNDAGELFVGYLDREVSRYSLDAIRQFKAATGATSTSPAATFDAPTLTSSLIVGFVGSGDTSSAAPSGTVEVADASQSTPTTALQVWQDYANSGARTTYTAGATQSTAWATIILEIDTSYPTSRPELVGTGGVIAVHSTDFPSAWDTITVPSTMFGGLGDGMELGDVLTIHVVSTVAGAPVITDNTIGAVAIDGAVSSGVGDVQRAYWARITADNYLGGVVFTYETEIGYGRPCAAYVSLWRGLAPTGTPVASVSVGGAAGSGDTISIAGGADIETSPAYVLMYTATVGDFASENIWVDTGIDGLSGSYSGYTYPVPAEVSTEDACFFSSWWHVNYAGEFGDTVVPAVVFGHLGIDGLDPFRTSGISYVLLTVDPEAGANERIPDGWGRGLLQDSYPGWGLLS